VPLLVLLTVFVFGLPEIGVLYSLFWTAVTAMSLHWAAFFCEAVRSGIRKVPRETTTFTGGPFRLLQRRSCMWP
jgi:glutamate transport system permease protein